MCICGFLAAVLLPRAGVNVSLRVCTNKAHLPARQVPFTPNHSCPFLSITGRLHRQQQRAEASRFPGFQPHLPALLRVSAWSSLDQGLQEASHVPAAEQGRCTHARCKREGQLGGCVIMHTLCVFVCVCRVPLHPLMPVCLFHVFTGKPRPQQPCVLAHPSGQPLAQCAIRDDGCNHRVYHNAVCGSGAASKSGSVWSGHYQRPQPHRVSVSCFAFVLCICWCAPGHFVSFSLSV